MIDKMVTLFLLGGFAGIFGFSIKTIVERGKIVKTVLISTFTAVSVGIIFDIFSPLPKSPLLYAFGISFFVSLLPDYGSGALQKTKLTKKVNLHFPFLKHI